MPDAYPEHSRARDRWILARRPPRRVRDARRPHSFFIEVERSAAGELVRVATIFLTNRECPWHCVMCDLWQYALPDTVPAGAIPEQIDYALNSLGQRSTPLRQIKLYNAGSFFDPRAIPPQDYPAIVQRVCTFERVIVECHPALVGRACLRFRDLLEEGASPPPSGVTPSQASPRLEVALGLETANSEVLAKLNKRMTLGQFERAAEFLQRHQIALRAFVLVRPPFQPAAEALAWAKRSIDFAFDCGAAAVSLIPTRGGNGALEMLTSTGSYASPRLIDLEAAAAYGLGLRRGRVFADLWDLQRFVDCPACFAAREARLRAMNVSQAQLPPVACEHCGASSV